MKYGATVLFGDYLAYWADTHNVKQMRQQHAVRSPKLTPDREKALDGMETWCEQEGLDPRRWLAALFYSRRFLFAPRWNQLCGGPASRKVYDAKGSLPLHEQLVRAAPPQPAADDVNPNRDVVPAAEIQKQNFAERGVAAECMVALSFTYGWHPKSLICQKCPVAGECRERLRKCANFDIVALREGRVTWEQVVQGLAMTGDQHGGSATR